MKGLTVLLFWTTIFFLFIGFAIMPFWNGVFALMAAFLGSLWAVSHAVDKNLYSIKCMYQQRRVLERSIEGIHDANEVDNVYLRNIFYTIALAALSDTCSDPKERLAKLYEAKYNESLPIPVRSKSSEVS